MDIAQLCCDSDNDNDNISHLEPFPMSVLPGSTGHAILVLWNCTGTRLEACDDLLRSMECRFSGWSKQALREVVRVVLDAVARKSRRTSWASVAQSAKCSVRECLEVWEVLKQPPTLANPQKKISPKATQNQTTGHTVLPRPAVHNQQELKHALAKALRRNTLSRAPSLREHLLHPKPVFVDVEIDPDDTQGSSKDHATNTSSESSSSLESSTDQSPVVTVSESSRSQKAQRAW